LKTRVTELADVESYTPVGHTNTVAWCLTGKAYGAQNVAVFLIEMRPGAVALKHSHLLSEHIFFVLDGRAKITAEEEVFEVGQGTTVYIPPNIEHEMRTTGAKVFRAIVVIAPPLPEKKPNAY